MNKVLFGDCLDLLKDISDNSIDMVFTDPPYMISNNCIIKRGKIGKYQGKDMVHDFGDWDHFESNDDFLEYIYIRFNEIVRVLRLGGMLFVYFDKERINFLSRYLQDKYNFKCKGYYADLKSNPAPQARGVKWMNGWEVIGMWQKPGGKLTFNYKLGQEKDYAIRSVLGKYTKTDGNRIHPTQKPISVVTKFINYWSNKNDVILDPFCGAGTTLVSAKKLNRRYIGIEKKREYYDFAFQRIKQTEVQGDFFL